MDSAVFFVEAASGTFCLVLAFWFVPLSVFCGVGVGVCNLLFVLFGRWVFNVPLSLFGKNADYAFISKYRRDQSSSIPIKDGRHLTD